MTDQIAPDLEALVNGDERMTLIILLTRLEAKVDIALAQHGAAIEELKRADADKETRLRFLEQLPRLSARVLWGAVATAVGLLLAGVPVLDRILGG